MPEETQKNSWLACSCIVWLIPIPFILVGGLLILGTIFDALQSLDASNWPSTQGEITQSSVVNKVSYVKTSRGRSTIITYFPDIRYSFKVNDKDYTGSRISYVGHGSDEEIAKAKANVFPVGKSVTVFYDPDDPNLCSLETHFELTTLIFPVIGSISCLIGIGLLLFFAYSAIVSKRNEKKGAGS